MRTAPLFLALLCSLLARSAHAGDVTAVVKKGSLIISGTGADDQLVVTQFMTAGARQFRLDPSGSTTVNGSGGDALIDDVKGDVRVDLGAGNNSIGVNVATLPRNLRLTAPSTGQLSIFLGMSEVRGSLTVDSDGAVATLSLSTQVAIRGDLVVRTGSASGESVFTSGGVAIQGDVKLDLGAGSSSVGLGEAWIRGKLTVRAAAGGDSVGLTNSLAIDGAVSIQTGAGAVTVNASDAAFGGKFALTGSSADDSVSMNFCAFAGDVRVDLGSGTNHFTANALRTLGGLRVTAREGSDELRLETDSSVLGACRFEGGDGTNMFVSNASSVGSWRCDGGAGTDTVSVANIGCRGPFRADLGDAPTMQANQIFVGSSSLFSSMTVNGGNAGDGSTVNAVDLRGTLRVRLGAGNNFLGVSGFNAGSIRFESMAGNDNVNFTDSTTRGPLSLLFGEGDNGASFSDSIVGGKLTVRAGAGDDNLFLGSAVVLGAKSIDLGGGTNTGP